MGAANPRCLVPAQLFYIAPHVVPAQLRLQVAGEEQVLRCPIRFSAIAKQRLLSSNEKETTLCLLPIPSKVTSMLSRSTSETCNVSAWEMQQPVSSKAERDGAASAGTSHGLPCYKALDLWLCEHGQDELRLFPACGVCGENRSISSRH
jgi:hypothetical protein